MDEESGAGELDPQRRSGESDLQGAPASLLSGEGGFQQGQSFTQTHGAGERAQHQVDTEPFTIPATALTMTSPRCSWDKRRESALASLPLTVSSCLCCSHLFYFNHSITGPFRRSYIVAIGETFMA